MPPEYLSRGFACSVCDDRLASERRGSELLCSMCAAARDRIAERLTLLGLARKHLEWAAEASLNANAMGAALYEAAAMSLIQRASAAGC